jgi:hypothetical protein
MSDLRLSSSPFQDRDQRTSTPPPMPSPDLHRDSKSRVPLHARSPCAVPCPCAWNVPALQGPFIRVATLDHARQRPDSPTLPMSHPRPGPTLPRVRLRAALSSRPLALALAFRRHLPPHPPITNFDPPVTPPSALDRDREAPPISADHFLEFGVGHGGLWASGVGGGRV